MNIIIVDSTAYVRQNLGTFLQNHGHEVITFASGREALVHLESYDADLLVAAEQLPDMLGSDVASHIRRWSAKSAMPMLVLHERNSPHLAMPCATPMQHGSSRAPVVNDGCIHTKSSPADVGDSVFNYLSQVIVGACSIAAGLNTSNTRRV
ncbi:MULTISPECIES: response regulator [Pseudomonadota]|jgi:CheY-like chemotaxis protein|uniref:Response regulatory domain-containing protein n=2 Tax=Ralstonia pickettii TaxID=329 RepID=R0DWI5_RALPI|nr:MULTISPECIES: response regulator [Pseudomonadota]ENZ77788.1 hypothetical protein OR214_02064 [Ralstonia pickettii OR214]MBL4779364.1 response regulator [Ralstonia sp.]MCM3582109.1 response regulator [Ralstonia pickettii]